MQSRSRVRESAERHLDLPLNKSMGKQANGWRVGANDAAGIGGKVGVKERCRTLCQIWRSRQVVCFQLVDGFVL